MKLPFLTQSLLTFLLTRLIFFRKLIFPILLEYLITDYCILKNFLPHPFTAVYTVENCIRALSGKKKVKSNV
jgi:hypothetical protein